MREDVIKSDLNLVCVIRELDKDVFKVDKPANGYVNVACLKHFFFK